MLIALRQIRICAPLSTQEGIARVLAAIEFAVLQPEVL
jgi:hypothetical protein